MTAYYNEIDPKAAAWLRELIRVNAIAPGVVDERSIVDVKPGELSDFTQCHFFAGIGGWSYALRLAGWPDDRPVWTGSCPCQPFSAAGKAGGFADERHLWPDFYRLIRKLEPGVVFGEQVASPLGLGWLDSVLADLEASDYAGAAFDLCAAGVGAPHIRQRLYWVGHACGIGSGRHARAVPEPQAGAQGSVRRQSHEPEPSGADDWLGDSDGAGSQGRRERGDGPRERVTWPAGVECDWVRTGAVWRPVEPGTFPLAHGVPARVGRLRGYGNAIVPQVAAEVIAAYMEIAQ